MWKRDIDLSENEFVSCYLIDWARYWKRWERTEKVEWWTAVSFGA